MSGEPDVAISTSSRCSLDGVRENLAGLYVSAKLTGDRGKHLDGIPRILLFLEVNRAGPRHCGVYVDLHFPRDPREQSSRQGQLLERFVITLLESSWP